MPEVLHLLERRISGLIAKHRATRCPDALAELCRIMSEDHGAEADEAHRFVFDEYGIVRCGLEGSRALVWVG